ncbi:MAG: hypothetical protein ACI96M_002867 [Candidatus Azotimanducaceae bacterium]
MAELHLSQAPSAFDTRLLLPADPDQFGPETRRLLIRSGVMLLGVAVLGSIMVFGFDDPMWRAAGLSLIFPGGGFLYSAWPTLFLLSLVGMAFAVLLWWGLSAFFAVPLMWFATAVGAALIADGPRLWTDPGVTWTWAIPVVFALALATAAIALIRSVVLHRRKVASIAAANEYLAVASEPQALCNPIEPNELDRELLAWMYELALQPLDQFEGYDWGEQYHGGTCLRYQLAFLGESLAAYAANALPNHQQMIEPALAAFIERMTDQRVWKYWQLENFLATGSLNPEPMANDNVMLTGFYQSQISLYEAATGSHRFDEPGSLKFVWKDGRVFPYDHKAITEAIVDNLKRSNLGLYSCEPTWVFTICNTQAAQGLVGYDRLHGTNYWGQVSERFRNGLVQEMMTADGAFRHIRTNVFGFSFNDGDGSGEYYTSGSHGFEDIAPDLARRGRILALKGVPEKMAALEQKIDNDGYLNLGITPTRERGTYIMSALGEWFGVIAAACAVGNERVFTAASNSMQRDCATGARFPQRPLQAGVQAIATSLWPRWGRALSLGQLNLRGYVAPEGPILAYAPWPETIVTKARSDDGASLDLVIEPYKGGSNVNHDMRFTALKPSAAYRLIGSELNLQIVADTDGNCAVSLAVPGRLALRLELSDA